MTPAERMTEDEIHDHLRRGAYGLPGDEAYVPPVAGVHGNVDNSIYIPLPAVGERCGAIDPISGYACDQRPFHPLRHVGRDEDQTWLWPVTYRTL